MPRKIRADAVIASLPKNQKEAIERWLFDDNEACLKVADRILQDFGVEVSETAVRRFFQHCAQQRVLLKAAESRASSNAVTDYFRKNPAASFEALLELIGQTVFEIKMAASVKGKELDLKTLKLLAEITEMGLKVKTDTRKLEQKDQQIKIELQKFQQKIKTDIEKGLDAIFEEVRGNAEALDLFNKFKAVVTRATSAS